tara:strand:+ start:4424 stop:5056 length:633 start_codon:yes stop_codon:yes gene_type:complete
MANLGAQAGSGFDASDITTGTLGNTVQDNITRLGTVTSGTFNGTFPAGHILQIVQSAKSDTASIESATFGDIPGTDQAGSGSVFCVKITPSATSSKILFMANLNVGSEAGNAGAKIKLKRDGIDIAKGNASGSNTTATFGNYGSQALDMRSMSMTYLDSPSTTSEITYKPQFMSEGASYSTWINRPDNLTGSATNGYLLYSNLIVMEVAG